MKKLIGITAATALTLTFAGGSAMAAKPTVPGDVLAVAQQGLNELKQNINAFPDHLGFEDLAQVERAEIGLGQQVLYIDNDKLRNGSASLNAVTKPANAYQFVVYADDMPKAQITVAKQSGKWTVVQAGGGAEDLGLAFEQAETFAKAKGKDQEPALVKSGPAFYWTVQADGQEYAIPAASVERGKMLGGFDYTKAYPAGDVVKQLQANAKKNAASSLTYGGGGASIQPQAVEGIGSTNDNGSLLAMLGLGVAGLFATGVTLRTRKK